MTREEYEGLYVMKYWYSEGIRFVKGIETPDGWLLVKGNECRSAAMYKIGSECFRTEEEAKAAVKKRAYRKLEALRKQQAKVRQIIKEL